MAQQDAHFALARNLCDETDEQATFASSQRRRSCDIQLVFDGRVRSWLPPLSQNLAILRVPSPPRVYHQASSLALLPIRRYARNQSTEYRS